MNIPLLVDVAFAFGLLIFLSGFLLRETTVVAVETSIAAPAARVWEIMTAWAEQPRWRKDLQRVEVFGEDRFIEFSKKGPPVFFNVGVRKPARRLELELSGVVTGRYVAELSESGGVTRVRATERVSFRNPFHRAIAKLFFNLEDFAKQYLSELKSRAELDQKVG